MRQPELPSRRNPAAEETLVISRQLKHEVLPDLARSAI
jgi:hypothetical protein